MEMGCTEEQRDGSSRGSGTSRYWPLECPEKWLILKLLPKVAPVRGRSEGRRRGEPPSVKGKTQNGILKRSQEGASQIPDTLGLAL